MKYLAVLLCAISVVSASRLYLDSPKCRRTFSFIARVNQTEFVMFTNCNPELSENVQLPICDDTKPLTESCERDISQFANLPGVVFKKILVLVAPEATMTISHVTNESFNIIYQENADPKMKCPNLALLKVGESCVDVMEIID